MKPCPASLDVRDERTVTAHKATTPYLMFGGFWWGFFSGKPCDTFLKEYKKIHDCF